MHRLEEGNIVVEYEVDACPLLHHLKSGTDEDFAYIRVRVRDSAAKDSKPGYLTDLLLMLIVGYDLGEFVLDIWRRRRLTSDTSKGLGRFVVSSFLHVVSG